MEEVVVVGEVEGVPEDTVGVEERVTQGMIKCISVKRIFIFIFCHIFHSLVHNFSCSFNTHINFTKIIPLSFCSFVVCLESVKYELTDFSRKFCFSCCLVECNKVWEPMLYLTHQA